MSILPKRIVSLPARERLHPAEVWSQLRRKRILSRISPETRDLLMERLWRHLPIGFHKGLIPRGRVRPINLLGNLRRLASTTQDEQQRRELRYVLRHFKVEQERQSPDSGTE